MQLKTCLNVTADQENVKPRCGRWLGCNPFPQILRRTALLVTMSLLICAVPLRIYIPSDIYEHGSKSSHTKHSASLRSNTYGRTTCFLCRRPVSGKDYHSLVRTTCPWCDRPVSGADACLWYGLPVPGADNLSLVRTTCLWYRRSVPGTGDLSQVRTTRPWRGRPFPGADGRANVSGGCIVSN